MPANPKPALFRRPAIFHAFPGLIAAESTRHGGVSPPPYASLNLGWNTDDQPENTAENRRRFLAAAGIPQGRLATSHQVHGREVLLAREPGHYEGYDALITNQKGIFVAVGTADCTPILIYDLAREAVAAIHAGWRGTVQEVAKAALQAMQREFGTQPEACHAYIGTSIDQDNYEVDEHVAQHFAPGHKREDTGRGKWFVSLKGENKAQLLAMGVPEGQVEVSPYSTWAHNEDYFSHRKENGTTGRMLAVIGLRTGHFQVARKKTKP
ncbi:MAG: peptidoglycan editing factor PgeF [Lewinellaceae bacterium]|nr:peptidoglycan editing factor PgeF [Lewinellaceae bacterium]